MQSVGKRNVRVLQLVKRYYPSTGGNQNQCRLISENLAQTGFELMVITERYDNKLARKAIIGNVKVYRLFSIDTLISYLSEFRVLNFFSGQTLFHRGLKRILFYLSEYVFMINIFCSIVLLKEKFDIVQIHQNNWIAFWGLAASRFVKKECFIKDATLNGFNELSLMHFSSFMKRFLIRNGYYVAISQAIRENLVDNGVSKTRIISIPNGTIVPLESNLYHDVNNEILFVGNFEQGKIKGLDILLEAISIVVKKHDNIKLLIIGNGNKELYSKYIVDKELESYISFLGNQAVENFYKNSFLFVLPSRSEGMSNSLLEAMSFGMPCISSNVSGSTDLIQEGINGLLFQNGNYNQLASAISYMFDNRHKAFQMGLKARKTIETNFSIKFVSEKYSSFYQSFIDIKN